MAAQDDRPPAADDPADHPADHPTGDPAGDPAGDTVRAEKSALRREVLGGRGALPPDVIAECGERIAAALLQQPELAAARRVAAYVGIGTEPPTQPLLDALFDSGVGDSGVQVLLPVLRGDDDLDWAAYSGPDSLTVGRHGLVQPLGQALGAAAVADCDVLLCPGLAVDPEGFRLGRGGGSYDRALARAEASTWTCVLLYDGEERERVPRAEHDRPVDAVATPNGVRRF
ncbi:MAG TPA: 5-formyltetrahydrofolate cyclo-ligase [Nocardioidaceae bacterium]|nr:5-formyltetrahydrofolate cyclo-ligase [Nocardioidaceae bacterium]